MSLVGSIILIIIIYTIYVIDKNIRSKKPLILNKDSVVILTGGCDGIGKLTAIDLVKKYRLKLVILDIQKHKFQSLQQQLQSYGGQIQFIHCDLSQKQSIDKAILQIKNKYKQIDLLINNAGIAFQKDIVQASNYKNNFKTIHINYLSHCHLFIQLLNQLKGHVVTIASVASIIRGNKVASYVASKAAIYAFFNSVRLELLDLRPNITMSLVCPYAIDTGMFQGFKNRMQMIFPILKPEVVVQVIHNAIINRPQVVWIPQYVGIILKLVNLLPDFYLDRLYKWSDTSKYTNKREKQYCE